MVLEILAFFPALGVIVFAYATNALAIKAHRRAELTWACEMLRLGAETRVWNAVFFFTGVACAVCALFWGKWFLLYAIMFMAVWLNLKRQELGQYRDMRIVNGLSLLLWLSYYYL